MRTLNPVTEAMTIVSVEMHPYTGQLYCVNVPCENHAEFKRLPAAAEYDRLLLKKTGWNSDRNVAYYKPVVKIMKSVTL